jgi:1-phosphofructokinase family hexose kinase
MIAVGGFNTSIDKLLIVDDLVPGSVLRARAAQAWPGGKGAHVALAAAVLGARVRLSGLVDAREREWFESWLGARGVEFHGIEFPGPVRTCLTIHDAHGRTTEIREPGPSIDEGTWQSAAVEFRQRSRDAAVAVLSGSVPPGAPASVYADLVSALAPVPVLVDAAGELLRLAVEAAPFCIKPNREEAEALAGIALDSLEASVRAARLLASRGVRLVIISRGDEGAVACWDGRACRIAAPSVIARNVVGAGDCLLGGVASAVARGDGITDAIRLGVACGSAKVLSDEIGLVRRDDVDALLPQVRVEWLD